jgi:hypothetical protein
MPDSRPPAPTGAPLHLLQVVPLAARAGRPGLHGPDDAYVDDLWLPVLGPASWVTWRHLARLLRQPGTATVTLADLAAATGLGTRQGKQAPINRALRRLEAFKLAQCGFGGIAVRAKLPDITDRQLARLTPTIQALHHPHRRTTAQLRLTPAPLDRRPAWRVTPTRRPAVGWSRRSRVKATTGPRRGPSRPSRRLTPSLRSLARARRLRRLADEFGIGP